MVRPTKRLLKASLLHWLSQVEDPNFAPTIDKHPSKFRDRIRTALRDQHLIGWQNVLKKNLSSNVGIWLALEYKTPHPSMTAKDIS